jgi:hypothetical protein
MAASVRIVTSLRPTGDDRTLPLLPRSMNKVELNGVFGRTLRLRHAPELLLFRL